MTGVRVSGIGVCKRGNRAIILWLAEHASYSRIHIVYSTQQTTFE